MDLWQGLCIGLCLTQVFVIHVESHGSMIKPPARNQANQYGFPSTPHNYDPNALNCGGKNTQWNNHDGKCGTCGDLYGSNGAHESLEGKYVKNSVIVGTYTEGGTLDVTVHLSAAHKGWFEFRLCKLDTSLTPSATSRTKMVTQECLNEHLLPAANSDKTRFKLTEMDVNGKDYSVSLRLPSGLFCNACVLQWWYKTGNSWGKDEDGTQCTGCGQQETFVNCADIAITPTNTRYDEKPTNDNAPNDNTNVNNPSCGNVDLDGLTDIEQKQLDVLIWSARQNRRMATYLQKQLMPMLETIVQQLVEIKESTYK